MPRPSGLIRKRITAHTFCIRRLVVKISSQPAPSDVTAMSTEQLVRIVNDNAMFTAKMVSSLTALLKQDRLWSEMIIGNYAERSVKRRYIEKNGDYLRRVEPAQKALVKSKKLLDAAFVALRRKLPDFPMD